MKFDLFKITIIGYLVISLMGCNTAESPPLSEPATPPNITPTSPSLTQGDSTTMPSNSSTPTTSGLENLIEQAKADLAQRLAVSIDQVTLVESTEVEWSDSSLGCPQPDMAYLDVITPGYRILLAANGTQYEYHSNRDAYVVYCDPSSLPKP